MPIVEQYHRRIVLRGARRPHDRLILFLLLPLSLAYGAISWIRGKGYDLGLLPGYRAPVKVISVGNISVGGTGKTPVVDWLVKCLLEQGQRPAIVSRGYGGSFAGEVGIVSAGRGLQLSPAEAGDEPCLLARRNPSVPVLIAKKRAAGVRRAVEEFAASPVILDDGFQHRAVRRDVDLVLVDGKHPLGNGLPLPAGLLREFPAALSRADLLLVTRATGTSASLPVDRPTWKSCHRLADYAVDFQGGQVSLAELAGKRLLAFAGIADPDNFFAGLEDVGVAIEKKFVLGDHERYDVSTLQKINTAANGLDALLTTEKDGVKLAANMFSIPCLQVPMDISIENEVEFKAELFRQLWRN